MFASLGTLSGYMDFPTLINFFHTLVQGKVLSTIFDTRDASWYLVYFFDMFSLTMSFVGAACVAVCVVEATVDFEKGLYANYAKWKDYTNQIAVFEVIIMTLFMGWSLVTTILALVWADDVWKKLEARIAEADTGKFGIETPLDWDKAIKVYVLLMLTGLTTLISGYSLTQVAEEAIDFFAEYEAINGEKQEADDKTTGDDYPTGVSAQNDFIYHTTTAVLGWFVLSAISIGGQIFSMQFLTFDDGFTCEIQNVSASHYDAAFATRSSMTDRESCYEKIPEIFKILDLNGDGIIEKCEDATFMATVGEDLEYALKFSGRFDLAALKMVCNENFKY